MSRPILLNISQGNSPKSTGSISQQKEKTSILYHRNFRKVYLFLKTSISLQPSKCRAKNLKLEEPKDLIIYTKKKKKKLYTKVVDYGLKCNFFI